MLGSVLGHMGSPGAEYYAASKGAIHSLTLPLARSLGPYGIRVVTIAPGLVRTNMTAPIKDGSPEYEAVKANVPLSRWGYPEEIADVAYMIIESTYMTGNIVDVNGGITTRGTGGTLNQGNLTGKRHFPTPKL